MDKYYRVRKTENEQYIFGKSQIIDIFGEYFDTHNIEFEDNDQNKIYNVSNMLITNIKYDGSSEMIIEEIRKAIEKNREHSLDTILRLIDENDK